MVRVCRDGINSCLSIPAPRQAGPTGKRRILALVGALCSALLAMPVGAKDAESRLVRCGAASCLQLSGYRDNPEDAVLVNGRSVAVEGDRRWQVHMPLDTLRNYADPHARSIEVSVGERPAREVVDQVKLPIGLLGNTTGMDSIVVTAG